MHACIFATPKYRATLSAVGSYSSSALIMKPAVVALFCFACWLLPTVKATCDGGNVQLKGTGNSTEGTVQLCVGTVYYEICDAGWSQNDAKVICSQLGYSAINAQAYGLSNYGSAIGLPIQNSNYMCVGTETNIDACTKGAASNCGTDHTAGVKCSGEKGICETAGHTSCCISGCNVGGCYCDSACHGFGDCCAGIDTTCPQGGIGTSCTSGDVRLVAGYTGDSDGRVQFCVNGYWSTICNQDSTWGVEESQVVCNQLGYPNSNPISYPFSAPYGQGDVGITVSSVQCDGTESDLSSCTSNTATVDCGHQFDVGVDCNGNCINGDIMIYGADGGVPEMIGVVLFCFDGHWTYISDDGWDANDAKVVCTSKNFAGEAHAYGGDTYGIAKIPPGLTNFECTGDELTLSSCNYNTTNNGKTNKIASVDCSPETACQIAGHTGCCTSSCNGGGCFCDAICHSFGDCCEGIEVTCPSTTCDEGDVRLVNGSSEYEGRVEVCINGIFGPVCDDMWNNIAAELVCSQLGGPSNGATATTGSYFPEGYLPIVAGGFSCLGNEGLLSDCDYTVPSCGHQNEAGVRCPVPCYLPGDLQLADGDNEREGRVELCADGVWQSICQGTLWSQEDAAVTCRHLGFSTIGAIAYGDSYFGEGVGVIAATDIQCIGTELNVTDCGFTTENDCDHSTDVGVACSDIPSGPCEDAGHTSCCSSGCNAGGCYCDSACYGFGDCCSDIQVTCPDGSLPTDCTNDDIRISGGTNTNQGLVEFCINGKWTSICDEDWDVNDAAVACTQAGFTSVGAVAIAGAYFGQEGGPIVLGNFQCTGTELLLSDCTSSSSTCSQHMSAGVVCAEVCPTEGAVRLVAGADDSSGYVELCSGGSWGAICDTNWCEEDAKVVCSQLGYSNYRAEAYGNSFFGQDVAPIQFTDVTCNGGESSLNDCSKSTTIPSDCSTTRLAGVTCFQKGQCENAGQSTCCTSNCNLGSCYCDLACHGFGDCCDDIDNLCPSTSSCVHGTTRLVDGDDKYEGRLEMCISGKWGTVCDNGFSTNEARAACSQLGLPSDDGFVLDGPYFGQGDIPVIASDFDCSFNTQQLLDCSYSPEGDFCCGHHRDVSIRCPLGCTNGDIKLTDGDSEFMGTVQICINGNYRTICDDGWSVNDAAVVCKQLGYSTLGIHAFGQSNFNNNITVVPGLTNMVCQGNESSWVQCQYSENPTCDATALAGVDCGGQAGSCELAGFSDCCTSSCLANGCYCDAVCHGFGDCCEDIQKTCPSANCTNGETRIVNDFGNELFAGRVEVCINGQWGAICNDDWSYNEAHVVCSQFNYISYGSVPAPGGAFGQSTYQIVANNFACNGFESTIHDCSYTASPDCGHHQDAGVYCNVKCDEGDVRLVNASSLSEGRLEVCSNSTWHPVCDEFWSTEDSTVVCRQLGLSTIGAKAYGHSIYGIGLTLSMSYGYNCTGIEANLTECMIKPANMCDADSTAGVGCNEVSICEQAGHSGCCVSGCNAGGCYCDAVCHTFGDCCDGINSTCPQTQCTDGDVRLFNGGKDSNGRVETCVNGQWGTVCDDDWSVEDASVVCGQLGFGTIGAVIKTGAYFGQGGGNIVAGSFQCTGTEVELLNCTFIPNPSCGHHQDAGVVCPELCQPNWSVRIDDGPSTAEGRIELCLNGQWSSVCADNYFCEKSASVFCKQSGFSSSNAEAYGIGKYGDGAGLVGIENLNCLGTEDNITQCQYVLGSSCDHGMDAGIKCKESSICESAGHTSCCTSGCFVSSESCWCDTFCHIFNDCCENIESTCPSSGGCTEGEKRLINGNETSGILNVCHDSKWKTVCSEGFGDEEAKISCRVHGLSEKDFTIQSINVYGQGEGSVYAKEFDCTGNENSITDCPGNEACCNHGRDVGLTCQYDCEDGDIRLVGGDTDNEGRVEVCYNRLWGTVCDDLWGEKDARVACKMAGLPWRGAVATSFASFGQGVGPIHLDNVECDGSEGTLWNCTAIVSNHNCAHFEDAGAICAPGPCELSGYTDSCCDNTLSDCQGQTDVGVCHCDEECEIHGDCCVDFDIICKCEENSIRLINGANEKEGRIEICINGEYGTVCDDSFDVNDATVVCRQLGYPNSSVEAFSFSYFGQGTGPILLDNLACTGDEATLIDCPSNGIGNHNCFHFEDAGVRCSDPICTNGETRLVHGDHNYIGRIEVCVNGIWGTICDDSFTDVDATVVCRSLNLPTEGVSWFTAGFTFPFDTDLTAMDEVNCVGDEEHILDCPHTTIEDCSHFEDVAVICDTACTYNGQARLVGGTDETNGRLEVCMNSNWGTVCDDSFDNNDAAVVCRQLNLPTGSPRSLINLQYGSGYGDIHYSEIECVGNETHLNNCTKLTGGFFCFHGEDVGISCEQGCNEGELKLVGGDVSTEGRVEVCRGGTWGTICDNSGSFGIYEARVICKELNFPYTAAQVASFGPGGDPIHYGNPICTGSDLSFATCSKIIDASQISCSHNQDVGVTCQESCTNGLVRLVDGTDSTNGRFEICIGGTWGTVCDDQFHNVDAKIVCRQLGLSYAGAEVVFDVFGYGEDEIAITTLHCEGTEAEIFDCFFTTGTAVGGECSHSNDVGIICQDVCSNGDIRLADGIDGEAEAPPPSGRVEVCFNGEWGTICEHGWSTDDARVTCGQLGFQNNPEDVRTFGGYKYGPGLGNIYFVDMTCTGAETCLVTCPSSTDTSVCTHDNDAGVRCEGVFTPSSLSVDETCPTTCNLDPPGKVETLNVTTNETARTAEIRWSEPIMTNGIITGYSLTVAEKPSLNTFVTGGSPNYILLESLEAGTPYTISLTAQNLCGVSDPSTKTFFAGEKIPTRPTITSAIRQTGKSFYVQWEQLSLADTRGKLLGYELSWAEQSSASATYSSILLDNKTTMFIQTSSAFIVDKSYNVRLIGKNSAGDGEYSEIVVPTTQSVFIQVKLFLQNNQDCGTWLDVDSTSKANDVIKEVSDQISSSCRCDFTSEYLIGGFQCSDSETQVVHFRGQLFSTSVNYNATNIASNITKWLSTDPKVTVDSVVFNVDSTCVVIIDSLEASFCAAPGASTGVGGVVIGSSIVVVIIVIVLLAGLIIFVVVLVRRVRHGPAKHGSGDASNEMVGYSNQMAFPEGMEDNISQRASSTIHDDDFQNAINMISDEVDQDMEKKKLAEMYQDPKISFSGDGRK